MTESLILALDQGTTSSRAILFGRQGRARLQRGRQLRQHYPRPGWVEHDPEEIWAHQLLVAQEVVEGIGLRSGGIAAIGITNQRETTIVWDRITGEPIYNAIVWQDRRTADDCDELKRAGWEEPVREKTGLVVDAYFSATKLRWLLDHVAGARTRAERGELLFGTVDTFLIYRLTGGRVHSTDHSNAARTMLFNIHTLQWDDDLLREFGIPRSMLPEVRASSGLHGETVPGLFGRSIPIAGDAGDQQAATFGQACYEPGMVKNTYGTGNFMLMNTGPAPRDSSFGLLTTIAWCIGGVVTYALEGSVFVTGAAIQWLRDELGLIREAAESEVLAASVPDTGGVYLVPAFVGIGTPYWDQHARGTIVGLTRGSGRAHLTRAALESVAYQSQDVLEAMRSDSRLDIPVIRVDGGMVGNDFLMQFQADISDTLVERPVVRETTALGAAHLAGLAVGYWDNLDEIARTRDIDTVFEPRMAAEERLRLREGWRRAVNQARGRPYSA